MVCVRTCEVERKRIALIEQWASDGVYGRMDEKDGEQRDRKRRGVGAGTDQHGLSLWKDEERPKDEGQDIDG